jgi:hypothetical protein
MSQTDNQPVPLALSRGHPVHPVDPVHSRPRRKNQGESSLVKVNQGESRHFETFFLCFASKMARLVRSRRASQILSQFKAV